MSTRSICHYLLIVFSLIFLPGCLCSSPERQAHDTRPNILLLLADDLGYGELGCYGQQVMQTPVLDKLATQGMQFTDFYAGNAVCSPSRAVLMTGKPSAYSTIRGNSGHFSGDRWMRVALKQDEVTIAEMLKKAGYQTGFVGKWHLDDPDDLSTWACKRGFDYALQEQWSNRFGGRKFNPDDLWLNGNEIPVRFDWTQWDCKDEFYTHYGFEYLKTVDTDKPFFLFMSYRAPHGRETQIGNKTLYADEGWPNKERVHAAKVTLLDKQIGRLLEKLDDMDELENTLVIFTSDNGPHCEGGRHDPEFFNSNGDLRGIKRDLYDGGIRVPLIVRWPGKVKPASVTGHISGFQDVMPTLAQVAGVDIPQQTRGISMLPVLTGSQQSTHQHLNWEFQLDGWGLRMPTGGFRQSVRMGHWKAVRYGIQGPTKLYNLEKDISESNDLADKYPDIVKKMNRIFEQSRADKDGFPYGGVIQHKTGFNIYREKNKK